MYSTRSSSIGSAQCRSSSSTTTGRSAASASNSRRTAQNVSSLPRRGSSVPSAPRRRCAHQLLVLGALERGARRPPRRRAPGRSRQRPVRDAVAVGEAAAGDAVARSRTRSASSRASRVLPMPGGPSMVTTCGQRSPLRSTKAPSSRSSSPARPTSGASRRREQAAGAPRDAATRDRRDELAPCPSARTPPRPGRRRLPHEPLRHRADQDLARLRGLLQPLGDVDRVARHERPAGRRPRRPRPRRCSSRSAIERARPTTRSSPSFIAPSPPASPSPRAPRAARRPRAADRTPKTAITASPMNFSTVPPWRLQHVPHLVDVARHHVPHRLRVGRLAQPRRAGHVAEEHGHGLAGLGPPPGVGVGAAGRTWQKRARVGVLLRRTAQTSHPPSVSRSRRARAEQGPSTLSAPVFDALSDKLQPRSATSAAGAARRGRHLARHARDPARPARGRRQLQGRQATSSRRCASGRSARRSSEPRRRASRSSRSCTRS